MYNLKLGGVLERLSGLIIGQFINSGVLYAAMQVAIIAIVIATILNPKAQFSFFML